MPDFADDAHFDAALRDGLRALPVSSVSPNFDACVLAALRTPVPWWQRLWQPAQPLLAGASFSLIVTLVCLHWSLSAPIRPPTSPSPSPILATRAALSLDALLDRPNLSAASLSAYWAARPPDEPPADRRPEPRRRAQTFHRPALIA